MMIKRFLSILLVICSSFLTAQPYDSYSELKKEYIQLSGELFRDVQLAGVFKDSKTFVDALPLYTPEVIRAKYDSVKSLPGFDIAEFVDLNFILPDGAADAPGLSTGFSMDEHIEKLWDHLYRKHDLENKLSTLIPLEHSYIVPGGRFREIYYWDSFFTILGLLADDKIAVADNMVYNFAGLLARYKMIPNGTRVYYLTRSQPPFFALMVDIVCRYKNDYNWGLQFINAMETEYSFWMNGINKLSPLPGNSDIKAAERVVLMKNGILNRYYDFDTIPREESYREDFMLAQKIADSLRPAFYRNLRAAAESGWDFSSRWFADGKSLSAINTTNILPVDLNCLLYFLEDRLGFFYGLKGDDKKSQFYKNKAEMRRRLINEIFWNSDANTYSDYNLLTGKTSNIMSLASCYPLYFRITVPVRASAVSDKIKKVFLRDGGLVTTNNNTGQQWDAPNGWAPLQWMVIKGLREFSLNREADEIKNRWLSYNENVYKRTGKMVEKYNVTNISLPAGGGEYALQDGFGWTNGVAAALLSDFDEKYLFKD
jgi:alpha,alpha-trehalase